jgi:glycosyltransferase involved in cell wall biosynthesis
MKKVLIISHLFFEQEAIGSIRIRGLAKFLPEFDWDPVILTVKVPGKSEPGFNVVETFYQDKQKKLKESLGFKADETVKDQMELPAYKNKKLFIDHVFYIWQEIFNYPDAQKGWYKYAINAGKKLLENDSFDAMISSSGPITSHIIAKNLKNRYGVPWVADLRDLWTQNHYYSHTSIRKLIERKLEIKTLAMADALVTISPYLAEKLHELHNKRIDSITNGFSYDETDKYEIKLTDKFTITYTGSLYLGKRDPIKLFQAVNELISSKIIDANDIEIRFYGLKESWLENEINSFNLEKIAKWYGFVERTTALEKQRESQLLLLLLWDHPEEKNVATGKLFDYLGSKRPILAIGGSKGFVKEILDETNAGIFAISIDEIKNFLVNSYMEWKKNGKVLYSGKTLYINKYSHREMAKKFSEVLERIIK